jgi:type II secretory pathway component PulF
MDIFTYRDKSNRTLAERIGKISTGIDAIAHYMERSSQTRLRIFSLSACIQLVLHRK